MKQVKVNDIVQITKPIESDWFGCVIIVTDVGSWGIVGFMPIPNKGDAYVRVEHSNYAIIGQAAINLQEDL